MKQTGKRRLIYPIAAAALALLLLVGLNLPRPVKASDRAFDLLTVPDGSYWGRCDNGLVQARVQVTVRNRKIAEVQILEHDNGLGGAAEAITDAVVAQQSVEVDAVSGATLSSKTILKAVEAALAERQDSE